MTRPRARLAEFCVRLGVLCIVALFVTASVASGRAYLWCAPMQQGMHDCCCDADRGTSQDPRHGESPTLRKSCCDSQVISELPAARIPPPADGVPPALAMNVVAPSVLVEPLRVLERRALDRQACAQRYGPTRVGLRSSSDTCIKLQVFRC